jgi:INO80 complex subunit C
LKQIVSNDIYSEQLGSYSSIEAGIKIKKPAKYCDFLGFNSKYSCPKSGLRYFSGNEFSKIAYLPASTRQELLAIRKANIVLK